MLGIVWFLYLDESGDLGFDFFNRKPSRFFTVAILALRDTGNNRALINAIKKTIRRKLREKANAELKGSHTSLEVKRYFYGLVRPIRFGVYAVTLNKKRVYEDLTQKRTGFITSLRGRFLIRCQSKRHPRVWS